MVRNKMLRNARIQSKADLSIHIDCYSMTWRPLHGAAEVAREDHVAASAAARAGGEPRPRATATSHPLQIQFVRDPTDRYLMREIRRARRYHGYNVNRTNVVQSQAEHYYPLAHWPNASNLSISDATWKSSGPLSTHCPPEHLEGLWVGTFGPHGTEFGWIHARKAEDGDARLVEYVKITGDVNVPSGVVSWFARLPGERVPTVQREDLNKWNKSSLNAMRAVGERWEAGTIDAYGQGKRCSLSAKE